MRLLTAREVHKSFGDREILRGADLEVESGEVVGLVGANGSGKSTLLKVLGGILDADNGRVQYDGTHALMRQLPSLPGQTVKDAARDALSWHQELLDGYEAAVAAGAMDQAAALQGQLDLAGWDLGPRVATILDRVKAPPADALLAKLSGGEARRVSLARVLLQQPDLLLLDEPTNHLDAETIEWLEAYLAGYRGGVVLVTHDRYLLERTATRIVEIDDGLTVSYQGSYGDYLVSRAERRVSAQKAQDRRLALIAHEAAWAARSPAARTTKQKGRLQRLDALRAVRPLKREETFSLDLSSRRRLGSTLLEMHGVRKAFGERVLVDDLELVLAPGDRVGIVGANGIGKSTLLKLMKGSLPADAGSIVKGPRVRLAMLDQERSGLDLTHTVYEAAGDGNDQVKIGDDWIHVASFLNRFLFGRETFDQSVSALSGGERARLLLARLLLEGSTVLLLDEPTNDLDLMTLRVLEEALLSFDGAAVIVTHDRAFLDRVCTQIYAFEGEGRVVRYASREQWLRAQKAQERATAPAARPPKPKPAQKVRRLSFAEKKELEALPQQIESLEERLASLEAVLADPATYKEGGPDVASLNKQLSSLPEEIEVLYARWETLSELA